MCDMLTRLFPVLLTLTLAPSFTLSAEGGPGDRTGYYHCDFNGGAIPEGITTIDNDGQPLHFTMVQLGFAERDSWICTREGRNESYYAASASRHKVEKGEEPVAASDWLVTPRVWICGGEAQLSWRSMSVNEQRNTPSTYGVFVSETGNTVADFTQSPLLTVTDTELNAWTAHTLDLSAYTGKRIYVAFVNMTLDGEVLAIDDIDISGLKGLSDIEVTPGEIYAGPETFRIGGTITACSDETVDALSLRCEVEGRTLEAEYSGLGLGYGESFRFEFDEEIHAVYGDKVGFTLTPLVNGTEYDPIAMESLILNFEPRRNVVIEEFTGM